MQQVLITQGDYSGKLATYAADFDADQLVLWLNADHTVWGIFRTPGSCSFRLSQRDRICHR